MSLNKTIISQFLEKKKSLNEIQLQIEDRIDYILKAIATVLKCKILGWYVSGAVEGEVGDLSKILNEENLYFIIGYRSISEQQIIFDKFGSEFYLGEGFPKRWLFEDFEQELVDGKLLYETKEAKKKKISKKELVKNIKSKLTPNELKILTFK